MTFNRLSIILIASRKKGRAGGSRFETASPYCLWGQRGLHLPAPAPNRTYMLMSRFFLEQRVSFTRGAFSSTRPRARRGAGFLRESAKLQPAQQVGKRPSISRTAAIG